MRVRINTHAGPIRAKFVDDWETGTTLYEVSGARVSGVFTVCLENRLYFDDGRLDPDTPHVKVGFGRPTGKLYERDYERADLPVVNGVQLCGTPGVNAARMREGRLGRSHMSIYRGRGYGSAPDLTTTRTIQVVEGVLTHWLTRPENYALRLAAIRHYAAAKDGRKYLEQKMKDARRAFREAMDALNTARELAAQGAGFAGMPPATYERYGLAEVGRHEARCGTPNASYPSYMNLNGMSFLQLPRRTPRRRGRSPRQRVHQLRRVRVPRPHEARLVPVHEDPALGPPQHRPAAWRHPVHQGADREQPRVDARRLPQVEDEQAGGGQGRRPRGGFRPPPVKIKLPHDCPHCGSEITGKDVQAYEREERLKAAMTAYCAARGRSRPYPRRVRRCRHGLHDQIGEFLKDLAQLAKVQETREYLLEVLQQTTPRAGSTRKRAITK